MPRRHAARPFAPALQRVADDLRPRTLLAEVQAVWDDAVGPLFAGVTMPTGEEAGVVRVAGGDAARASELTLLREHVVANLNARLGRPAVTDLRVQAKPPPG